MQKVILPHDTPRLDSETKDKALDYTWYGWEQILIITDGFNTLTVKDAKDVTYKSLGISYNFIVE